MEKTDRYGNGHIEAARMQTPTLVLLTSMFPPTRASKGGRGLSLSFLRPLRLGRRAAEERNAAKEKRQCTAYCCVNIALAEQHQSV